MRVAGRAAQVMENVTCHAGLHASLAAHPRLLAFLVMAAQQPAPPLATNAFKVRRRPCSRGPTRCRPWRP
jgi:hypothetical protein